LAAVCLKMYESHIHNNNNNNNLGCDERYACHFFGRKRCVGGRLPLGMFTLVCRWYCGTTKNLLHFVPSFERESEKERHLK
jgi:hypothetical protein